MVTVTMFNSVLLFCWLPHTNIHRKHL